jgi:hypothetical protein
MVNRGSVLVFHCITITEIAHSHAIAELIKKNITDAQHIKIQGKAKRINISCHIVLPTVSAL